MAIDIKIPVFPESVSEGTLLTWYKKPGDFVELDEKLLDVETSKQMGWQATIDLEQGIRQVYQDYCCYEKNRRVS